MKFKSFLNEKLEEWVLVASLLFMTLLVIGQVISRYVINYPMSWSIELSRYILIWIAWISASYAVHKNAHIRVDILINKLSGNSRKVLEFIVLIIWFSFSLFLAIIGTQFVMKVGETNQLSPSLGLSMDIVYLAVPIAGVLMSLRLIQQSIIIFRK